MCDAGGAVLVAPEPDDAVAAELCGVRVEAALPRAEWFVTLADRPDAVRLPRQRSHLPGLGPRPADRVDGLELHAHRPACRRRQLRPRHDRLAGLDPTADPTADPGPEKHVCLVILDQS